MAHNKVVRSNLYLFLFKTKFLSNKRQMNVIFFLEAPILDVKLSSKSVALPGFAPDHTFSQYKIKH